MRRSTLIVLVIILIVLIVAGFFITDPDSGKQLLVDLGLAEPTQEGYVLSGLVEAQVTTLSSEIGGRVMEFLVSEGTHVETGETLARVDSSQVELELEASEARLGSAQAQLDMVMAEPRDVDIAVAQAAVSQAQAVRDGSLTALEDARNSTPESLRDEQVAVAEAALEQAEANLQIAQTALETLQNGASDTTIDSASAAVASAEADVERLQEVIDKQTLSSPIESVVHDIFLLPGEYALPGEAIISIADISEVEVTVFMPESDLNQASLGDIVEVKFNAYPDQSYVGVVTYISDRAEFTPRNVQTPDERVILVYPIRIRIANPGGDLKPGLSVDVIFGGES